jgi:tagatose-1,6-bisphosphate aldolase
MPELNREEIIKALEWCIQSEGCEYCEYNKGNVDVCSIRSDALTLIKQLTEENERLKEKADRHLDNLKAVLDERAEEKSEVEFLKKTITQNAQKALEVTIEEIEKAKTDVAREILNAFASFRALSPNFCKVYNEFEKKYIGE